MLTDSRFYRRFSQSFVLLLLILSIFWTAPISAGVVEDADCRVGIRPAASLLLPYFEVDLDDPEGPNTLMAIENIGGPAFVRVTLWTDWGIPTLAFDLDVGPSGVRSLNLRNLFEGDLPNTDVQACGDPLIPAIERDALQRAHTGVADPGTGFCSGSTREDQTLAIGYVTVDVLNECRSDVGPTDDEYFGVGEAAGIVGSDNVLSGDFFLIDPGADSAQSGALVHLPADPEFDFIDSTFYRSASSGGADARIPLSDSWRVRYLNGGIFDGGTDLLIWVEPFRTNEPTFCGEFIPSAIQPFIDYYALSERSDVADGGNFMPRGTTSRVRVGSEELPVPSAFGSIELSGTFYCGVCSPPFAGRAQMHVTPVTTASGRFSSVRDALPLRSFCHP